MSVEQILKGKGSEVFTLRPEVTLAEVGEVLAERRIGAPSASRTSISRSLARRTGCTCRQRATALVPEKLSSVRISPGGSISPRKNLLQAGCSPVSASKIIQWSAG